MTRPFFMKICLHFFFILTIVSQTVLAEEYVCGFFKNKYMYLHIF